MQQTDTNGKNTNKTWKRYLYIGINYDANYNISELW